MKQAPDLTINSIFSETFNCLEKRKNIRTSFGIIRKKVASRLSHHRHLFWSTAMIALVGVLFLTSSYLFFIQLATYGW